MSFSVVSLILIMATSLMHALDDVLVCKVAVNFKPDLMISFIKEDVSSKKNVLVHIPVRMSAIQKQVNLKSFNSILTVHVLHKGQSILEKGNCWILAARDARTETAKVIYRNDCTQVSLVFPDFIYLDNLFNCNASVSK